MNAPRNTIRKHDGIPYPHAPIAATADELGRKPTIHELIMGALDALTVKLDERYPGMAHDPQAIATMMPCVELAAGALDAPPRGNRGAKRGRGKQAATGGPDINSLHWFAHVRRYEHEPVMPLFWAFQREFLGPNGQDLDHRTDARNLLLQHGYGIPDDASALVSDDVNEPLTRPTDEDEQHA